jgi:hypothetical protein
MVSGVQHRLQTNSSEIHQQRCNVPLSLKSTQHRRDTEDPQNRCGFYKHAKAAEILNLYFENKKSSTIAIAEATYK